MMMGRSLLALCALRIHTAADIHPSLLLLLLQAIPQVATAPVLVLVGAMMMGESTHIDWSSMMTAVPAFLTIVIQPFTFSIANGIYAGLVMSILLYLLTGSFLETLGFTSFGGSKDAGLAEEDLEAYIPVLDGPDYAAQQTAAAAGASAVAIEDSNGINVHRRSSAASVPVGSLPHGSRGTPYERGSFSMYINTFGSHTASPGRFVLGSQMGAGSHVGSHMGSEEPEH
jgi:AGZA family xanthine/uracil permease-like MFS transporter